MSLSDEQSNGFLPLAALTHDGPTALGVWDLETGSAIQLRTRRNPSPARDQLVLARLHGEPLAILHIDAPPGSQTEAQLTEALWAVARDAVLQHVRSRGCLLEPTDAGALQAALGGARTSGRSCPGQVAVRPPGHAAVVVCTIGRSAELSRCIESLAAMSCADFTIVVVDNRPSDPQTQALVASFAARTTRPVRYVAEPRVGASAARNAGIAAVPEATFLAFTDDDVEVDPEWLSRLLEPFIEPQVGAVTGLVLPMTLDSAVQKRFERYAGFGKGVHGGTYDMGPHRARDRFLFPYWGGVFGSGNSMAFRRDALLAVGGFDPALGPGTPTGGAEDIAALSDVILGGGTIVYEPRSVCWHAHRDDEAGLREQVHRYGIGLTAVLWRYFRRDWRFTVAMVRSLPLVLELTRSRSADRQADRLPTDLLRLESRGRLLGPWRYEISRRRQTDHP